MWQVEQNSGVLMNGFMNVWRWRDGSIRIRSLLTSLSSLLSVNANGYCLLSSMT